MLCVSAYTTSWRTIVDENWNTKLYYTWFFDIFDVGLKYVTFKMIQWAEMKGRHF